MTTIKVSYRRPKTSEADWAKPKKKKKVKFKPTKKGIKPATCRAKGKSNEKAIAELLAKRFDLDVEDFFSCRSGQKERDIQLSKEAKRVFPFHVEAKHVNSLNIWDALNQAETEASGLTPVVVFKRDRSERYIVLNFETFLEWVT